MKTYIYYILFIIFYSCKTVDCIDTKACNYFFAIYERLENFSKNNYVGQIKETDVFFIEKLTNIECNYTEGFDILYEPTEQNLRDWKKWYDKNKDKLYWDEKEEKVKLRK